LAKRVVDEFQGELPCEEEVLLSFAGVGPKCTNLVMGIACGEARIGVDIHVHRVTNRWGYVQASTPERTMSALEVKLPRRYWVELTDCWFLWQTHLQDRGHAVRLSVLDMCQRLALNTIADTTE
jgi:endonuclease-3